METQSRHRVAILVACHNDGATLDETLDSLRREPNTELVVVDDGSTDLNTLRKLDAFALEGVRVLRQENAGPSVAWMTGVSETSAPYVMPFSSDDVLLPGATSLLASALEADQAAGFAWGDMETVGLARAYRPSVPVLCPWLVTFTNCMPGYSLFRRPTLLAVGGWRPTDAPEDWDLWMRLAARGIRGVYVNSPIFLYRRDAGGRFRGLGSRHEPFYAELREKNRGLFDCRAANRAASPAPQALKVLLPLVDGLPGVSRLKKIQLAETLTLLFWSGGIRRTLQIIVEGTRFRIRLLRSRRPPPDDPIRSGGPGARARD